jgi:hypothetical protein
MQPHRKTVVVGQIIEVTMESLVVKQIKKGFVGEYFLNFKSI